MPSATLYLTRPKAIEFELANGTKFVVQPPGRGQWRAAFELDPEPGEVRSPADVSAQRALQLAALVGPLMLLIVGKEQREVESAAILDQLTADEEIAMLDAFTAQSMGLDPAAAVAVHELKKKLLWVRMNGSLDSTATAAPSPIASDAP